jgi:hypothetical protein
MRRPSVAFGLAAGLYVLLTIALTWPLVLYPGSRVPNDLGDSLLNIFLLGWDARVMPFTERWWNLPMFYPVQGAMAFSEHLLGLSVLTTPVIAATGNALLGYNVVFFLSFPLCAIGAHLLAFHLTRRHDAALVTGIAYAFAPYRMAQFSHIQVLSSYWIPFTLLGLHLFIERRQRRWLVLFAGSWYMQAMASGYHLFYLSVLVGLWLLWFAVGRIRWADLGRILLAWAVSAAALVPIALGYLKYQRAYGFRRWPDEIQAFSADIASIVTAGANLRLWGSLRVFFKPESEIFPGLTILIVIIAGLALAWASAAHEQHERLRTPRIAFAVAVVAALVALTPPWFGAWKIEIFGVRLLSVSSAQKPLSLAILFAVIAMALHPSIRAGWRRRSPLAFYAISAFIMWTFSLGPAPTLMGRNLLYKGPYALLMMMPGVDGVRVPARFWTLAILSLAVAAALGIGHIVSRRPALRVPLVATIALLVLLEGWPMPMVLREPPDPRPIHARATARLELPLGPVHDVVALYRAAQHRRPLFNGYSGYFATHYGALHDLVGRRNGEVLRHLASFGAIEIVVDHRDDRGGVSRGFIGAQPEIEVVTQTDDYTVYRLPRTTTRISLPELGTNRLPIAAIRASLNQDRVGRMTDGDLISRWDTGGPQSPTNEVVIDLGAVKGLQGIELLIAGYLADFPRQFVIELSDDAAGWTPVWNGDTALIAFDAALEAPLTVPLRFPLQGRSGRFIRLRQTGEDPIYYWSIAELGVYGQ